MELTLQVFQLVGNTIELIASVALGGDAGEGRDGLAHVRKIRQFQSRVKGVLGVFGQGIVDALRQLMTSLQKVRRYLAICVPAKLHYFYLLYFNISYYFHLFPIIASICIFPFALLN